MKLYSDMKQTSLVNAEISLVNVILSIHILKIISDMIINALLQILSSYILMTMTQYIFLSFMVIWHIDLLPKLQLKYINICISQFVSLVTSYPSRDHEMRFSDIIDQIPDNNKYLELYTRKVISFCKTEIELATQNDNISDVSTVVASSGDGGLESGTSCGNGELESGTYCGDKELDSVKSCGGKELDSVTLGGDEELESSDQRPTDAKVISASILEEQTFTQAADLVPEVLVDIGVVNQTKTSIENQCEEYRDERIQEMDQSLCRFANSLKSMEYDLESLSTKISQLNSEIITLSSDEGHMEDSTVIQKNFETAQQWPSQDEEEVRGTPSSDQGEVGHKETRPQQVLLGLQYLNYICSIVTKYNGDRSKYRTFKNRFCTITDSMPLTDTDKGLILYMSLEDPVIDYLGKFTEDGHISYQRLWRELDYEFDTPLEGRLHHVAALFSIDSMDVCDTLEKLVNVYKFLKVHYVALERINAAQEVEGFKLKLLSKLRGDVADQVSSYIIQMESKPVVPGILAILREEISIMEIQQIADSLNTEVPKSEDPTSTTPSSQSAEFWCIFCRTDKHPSNTCNRYSQPSDYQKILFQHGRCYNCMERGHKGYECSKPRQCHMCSDQRKHCRVMCSCYH